MRILIAYDGSTHADAAIEDLRRAGMPRQCEAIVVSVVHHGSPDAWKTTMKEAEAIATEARDRIQSYFPGWSVSSEALWGDPAKMILKTIDVWKPDLVVIGSHGRSAPARLILGSVSAEVIRHAPCSIRVVRERAKSERPIRVLIATDGSASAEASLDAAVSRSWPEGTEARVLAVMQSLVPVPTTVPALEGQTLASETAYHVIEEADERERVRLGRSTERAAERLQEAGLVADSLVIDGDPRTEVNAEAERWQADCVFVGARGLGALDRLLLGSVSGAVVGHAHCAVEVVRHR